MRKLTAKVFVGALAAVMVFGSAVVANPTTASAAKVTVKKVTVKAPSGKTAYVAKGKKISLTTTVTATPNKAANKKVTYKSANKKIATVTAKGVVKGVKAGTTKITVVSKKNKKKKATIKVVVKKGAVTKIKLNATKATLEVGKTKTLKATVTAKNGSKKVVWSTSNKAVATVSTKGVVTAKKVGSATITVKATDGSGKKATCKVTVAAKGTDLKAMDIVNSRGLTFQLSAAQAITADNIALKSKSNADGTYQKDLKVDTVTSTDNVNYQIVLNQDTLISEYDYVQLTVTSLTGVKTLEKQYREANAAYESEEVSSWTKDEYGSDSFYFEQRIGYASLALSAVPAGLTAETKGSTIRVKGKPTAAGVTDAVLTATDEYGNTLTRTVHFIVGAENQVVGASVAEYGFTTDKDEKYTTGSDSIVFVGGSGNYKYELVDKAGTDAEKTSDSDSVKRITATLAAQGDYNFKIKATDVANANLSCEVVLPVHIIQGVSVAGIIKDASGNPIENAYVSFTNKNKADKYSVNKGTYADDKGSYSIKLSPGTYDIVANNNVSYYYYDDDDYYYSGSVNENALGTNYLYKQELNETKSGFDIALPVYKVTVLSGDKEKFTIGSSTRWYIDNEYAGRGDTIYLKPGTYKVESKEYESEDVQTKTEGTWWTGLTTTSIYTNYVYAASVTVGNAAAQITVNKETVPGQRSSVSTTPAATKAGANCYTGGYYSTSGGSSDDDAIVYARKFVPYSTGKYRITSEGSAVKFYALDGNGTAMTPDADGYYDLTADTTYIVGTGDNRNVDFRIEMKSTDSGDEE